MAETPVPRYQQPFLSGLNTRRSAPTWTCSPKAFALEALHNLTKKPVVLESHPGAETLQCCGMVSINTLSPSYGGT